MIRWILAIAACGNLAAHAQTQIDLTHQVRNALGYGSGGTNATSQIAARASVGTPKLVATDFSGADIGAQVNNAFASFGTGNCGTVVIPQGTYTFSNTIFVLPGCTLEGLGNSGNAVAGTQLVYAGPAATSAIVLGMNSSYSGGDDAHVRGLFISSNAGICPNSGMLRWNASASGANKWQCGVLATSQTVTGATNASPIAITVTAHGYSTGNRIHLGNIQGNTAANGEWTITVVDANTFTLNGSTGNGVFITGVGQTPSAQLVTYSSAVPHLAAIQHGAIDPNVLADSTHETIEHVRIDGSSGVTTQGRFHFGVYFNGCEECIIEQTHVEGADDGFALGANTNATALILPSARLNRRSGIHVRGFNALTIYSPLLESNEWWAHGSPAGYGIGFLADVEDQGSAGGEGGGGLVNARIYGAYYENNVGGDIAAGAPNGVFTGVIEAVGTRINRGVVAGTVSGFFIDAVLKGCAIPNGALVHVYPGADFTHDCNISSGAIDNSQGSARVLQMIDGRPVYIDTGIGWHWTFSAGENEGNPAPMRFSSSNQFGNPALALDSGVPATAGSQVSLGAVQVFSGNGWASGPGQSQHLNFGIGTAPAAGTSTVGGSLQITAKANANDIGDLGPAIMNIFPDGTVQANTFAAHRSTPSPAVAGAAGTGASCVLVPSVAGSLSDMSGKVRLTTGTAAWSPGTQCTVTFASSALTGYASLTPSNANASAAFGARQVYVDSSLTGFTINFGLADVAQTTYEFIWHAIGYW